MQFNPHEVDLDAGKVKKDWYPVVIDQAWESETKAGDGRYVQVDLIITSGEHKGLKCKDFICYQHVKETAQQIGSARLAKLCFAVGIDQLEDELELRNKTLEAYLVPDPDSTFPQVKDYRAPEHRAQRDRNSARNEKQMDAFEDDDIPDLAQRNSRPPARPSRGSRGG